MLQIGKLNVGNRRTQCRRCLSILVISTCESQEQKQFYCVCSASRDRCLVLKCHAIETSTDFPRLHADETMLKGQW